jgi:cell division septation protein DedD
LAQDDYYYEIQLTNKQLVFYFMAGAAGLILSFLAGVMVGRGVEGNAAAATETRPVAEDRVVAESSPAPASTPLPAEYSYPQRLESDRAEEGLDSTRAGAATPSPAPPPTRPAPTRSPAATPAATPTPRPAATPAATPPPGPAATLPAAPTPRPAAPPAGPLPKALGSASSGFAVQVGAFKDKAGADGIVKGLRARGLPAYTVPPPPRAGGLFTVRVGVYRDRADAEAVLDRLRDDQFKPFIIKQ